MANNLNQIKIPIVRSDCSTNFVTGIVREPMSKTNFSKTKLAAMIVQLKCSLDRSF